MKILLANPPAYLYDNTRHFIQAGSRWSFSIINFPKDKHPRDHYLPYPFFLAWTLSLLREKLGDRTKVIGIDFCALDASEKEFLEFVERFKPDILLVEIPTISFPLMARVLKEVKYRLPETTIIISGLHGSALWKEILKSENYIDYILVGEYEVTTLKLVNAMLKYGKEIPKEVLKEIPNLAFRLEKNPVLTSHIRVDINKLPFPDRENFKIEYYHDFEILGKPTAQIMATRGCPSSCIFCAPRHVFYRNPLHLKRLPENVIEEIIMLKYKYRVKQIYFDDETLTVDKKYIRELCKIMIEEKIDIPWTCMGDITIDSETLHIMYKAGCVGIKFGIETINEETLKRIGKVFVSAKRALKLRKLCKQYEIWTHATYIIGLPFDTIYSILSTIKFSTILDTESAQFSIATPLPGTPFFELCEKNNWLVTHDWTFYDGSNYSVVSYPHLSYRMIERLYKYAIEVWYRHTISKSLKKPLYMRRILTMGPNYVISKIKNLLK